MKKIIFVLVLMVSVLLNGFTQANAETQTAAPTWSGYAISCYLSVDWNLFSSDNATAKTNWSGKSGYQVKVKLLYTQDNADEYHTIDTDYGDKTALVKAAKSGVWTYKSYHAVYNKKTKDAKRVCTLNDW